MIFAPEERLKKKMQKDGSVLKYMYRTAGAKRGLIIGGLLLFLVGILLYAVPMGIDRTTALWLGVAMAVPGGLLSAGGLILEKNRLSKWQEVWEEKTGLSRADLLQADREFKQPGTVLLAFEKSMDNASLKEMGFLTENYLKMPGTAQYLYRLEDMVACFYTDQFIREDGGYDHAFVAYSTDKTRPYMWIPAMQEPSDEIIKMLERCNPGLVTTHFFACEGRRFDAVRGFEEVIDLHNQILERRMKQEAERT
ncbi:MAG: hypothetical protein HFE83_01555 [Lachnospiraceae bacterium]|jgi:hypothetical protein|nr:hypothetical protein [Lachnospiraceae bacterium]